MNSSSALFDYPGFLCFAKYRFENEDGEASTQLIPAICLEEDISDENVVDIDPETFEPIFDQNSSYYCLILEDTEDLAYPKFSCLNFSEIEEAPKKIKIKFTI